MRARIQGRRFISLAAMVSACAVAALPAYAEKTEVVLYNFCQTSGCPDGEYPDSPLVQDIHGNLFGTTVYGGNSNNAGTIYELQKVKKSWFFRSLYSFCSQANCSDGKAPSSNLIVDSSGNLYGTTILGGTANKGVAYKLRGNGDLKVLYSFCAQSQCTDGEYPEAGLTYQGQQTGALYDGTSTLYGTTDSGGASDWGVVYAITPGVQETVLYSFGTNGPSDGENPASPMIIDSSGNLYGSTGFGGSLDDGTIFSISPSGTETLSFGLCTQEAQDCGAVPTALLMMSDGTLVGATLEDENHTEHGIIFSFAADTFATLANFCTNFRRSPCRRGSGSLGLVQDSSENLYGVSEAGGINGTNEGTVFELTGSKLRALYSFCAKPNCTDGAAPIATPLVDGRGALFGTTTEGGAFGGGTIFELR